MEKRKCYICKEDKYCWDRCYGCPMLLCLECYSGKNRKLCDDCQKNYGRLYSLEFLYLNSLRISQMKDTRNKEGKEEHSNFFKKLENGNEALNKKTGDVKEDE